MIMMGISGYATGYFGNEYGRYASMPQKINGMEGIGNIGAAGRQSTKVGSSEECQTCKNRKYIDGSNEADVSFKTPSHIAPEKSASMVMSHEQMHVSNARQEGSKENADLVSASVRLKTAVCPECGKTYVAGGTTSTMIKYAEENPYEKNRKLIEGSFLKGQFIDAYAG